MVSMSIHNRQSRPWRVPIGAWKGQPTFIIGGGKSLTGFDFNRLHRDGVRVIALNSAYRVAPWADAMFFADRRWYDWNKDDLHLFTGGPVITRSIIRDPTRLIYRLNRESKQPLSHDASFIGGWCSGGCGLNLAYLYGADPIFLLGYDMVEGNWHDWHQLPPKPGQHRNSFIPPLERMAPELAKAGRRVFNTNPRSALRCFPFIDLEEVLAMSVDELTKIEQEKYEEIWNRPEYRRTSPGMRECALAFEGLRMKAGDTLLDFGSGPCLATKWFRDQGLDAKGVDFARNASSEPSVPVYLSCLWEMDAHDIPPAKFGFCSDVMEHIPEEKVLDVFRGIFDRVTDAVWMRIALRPDVMGPKLIGQHLHLTVKPTEWWRRQMEEVFPRVDIARPEKNQAILVGRK